MIYPKIESINIGQPEILRLGYRDVFTAIRKKPTLEGVEVDWSGIVSDGIGDKEHHGGFNRAIHCFSAEHYKYFSTLIAENVPDTPWVGENLTLRNYTDFDAHVGDRLRIGSCVFEVTMPTERCTIPGMSVELPKLLKWMIGSLRLGFYMRVVEPGRMRWDDKVKIISRGKVGISYLSSVMYGDLSDVRSVSGVMRLDELANEWKASLWKKHEKRSRKD